VATIATAHINERSMEPNLAAAFVTVNTLHAYLVVRLIQNAMLMEGLTSGISPNVRPLPITNYLPQNE
jgi:hypothetical protein